MLNDYGKGLFRPWVSVPNIVLASALIFCIGLLKLTSSEVASWVQALGSIASIWAAFLIGNMQIRTQNQLREQEAANRSAAFYCVVKNAVNSVVSIAGIVEQGPNYHVILNWKTMHCQLLKNAKHSLSQLPSYQLGSYDLVDSFHQIAGSIDSIISQIDATVSAEDFPVADLGPLRLAIETQCSICKMNWSRFEQESQKPNAIALPVSYL